MINCLETQFYTTYLRFIEDWLEKSDKVYLRSRIRDGKVNKYYEVVPGRGRGKRFFRSVYSEEAPLLEKQMRLTKFYSDAKADFLNRLKLNTDGRISTLSIIEQPWNPPKMPIFFDKLSADRFETLHPANEVIKEHGIRHGNIIVRSKAEDMLATVYDEFYLPYIYESRIQLLNYEAKPDFSVLLPFCGCFYFHEHLGMADDDVYMAHANSKIIDYGKVGIYPGRNLLLTSECSDMPASFEELKNCVLSFIVSHTI